MSSSSRPASPLQPHRLRDVILTLRLANVHYTHIAGRIRASLTPTRHAKTRAQSLGLTVDIVKAVNCPHKQVSSIPLPIIEVVSPVRLPSSVPRSIHKRPALTCTIPVMQTVTSPNGTTSALSSGSVYSSITLTSSQGPSIKTSARSHWSPITADSERFPRDATESDASPVLASSQEEPPTKWQPLDVPINQDPMVWGLDLQYPAESNDMDISPCASASSISSTSISSPSSASEADSESSASSSAGPVTPPNAEETTLPLMIRIKRKSMEIRDINEMDDDSMSEKRVRVFSAEGSQRRNVIRVPARR